MPSLPIPTDVALQICARIREECHGKWYTRAGLHCWSCWSFTHGNPEQMCFRSRPGNRGCELINAIYDRQVAEAHLASQREEACCDKY